MFTSSVSSTPSTPAYTPSTTTSCETAGSIALYSPAPETAGSIASTGWIA